MGLWESVGFGGGLGEIMHWESTGCFFSFFPFPLFFFISHGWLYIHGIGFYIFSLRCSFVIPLISRFLVTLYSTVNFFSRVSFVLFI